MRCFYLIGYHGCGKTTQANRLELQFPQFNYIGGKLGLDAVRSVDDLVGEIKKSKTDIVIHGCIFQTVPMIQRLSRLTDLHLIVMHSLPETVKERTFARGADDYNIEKFRMHYRFIKKLPELKKQFTFKLSIVDNNRPADEVYKDIVKCVQS
jgi:dephospho-CoA kinase